MGLARLLSEKKKGRRGEGIMIKYIGKRILMMIPVMFGVTLLIFTLLYFANGDPARNLLGAEATEEEVQELRDEWGLDDPYLVRYGNYLKQLLVDRSLGVSYVNKKRCQRRLLHGLKYPLLLRLRAPLSQCYLAR